jgi:hypothetical protein
MKEYTIRPSNYLYKDDYGKIRCIICKRFISLILGYCEKCVDLYEKKIIG